MSVKERKREREREKKMASHKVLFYCDGGSLD